MYESSLKRKAVNLSVTSGKKLRSEESIVPEVDNVVTSEYSAPDEPCSRPWSQNKYIGRGVYGKVYSTCKREKCDWVLKVSELNTDKAFSQFQRDQHFLQMLKDTQVVPKIEDVWICDDIGNIVMEKFDGTVDSLIIKGEKEWFLESWLMNGMLDAIEVISKYKIIHADVKPDNFLYFDRLGEKRVVITDFGTAVDYTKGNYEKKSYEGWTSNWGCKSLREYVELYNLFQLELWFRLEMRNKKIKCITLMFPDKPIEEWTHFPNISEEIRTKLLQDTCPYLKF